MDLARLLGSLYRIDKGIDTIEYNEKTYTWNEDSSLKGSKWESEGITLVSKIVSFIDENKDSLGSGVSFNLNLKGKTVTFVVKTTN